MAGNGVRFHVDLSFAGARRGTMPDRLSSLFDQSIPARLQIMMFSPPVSPRNKAGIYGRKGGIRHWITFSRHSVARTRNDNTGSKLFRNAVNALFSAPWYFQNRISLCWEREAAGVTITRLRFAHKLTPTAAHVIPIPDHLFFRCVSRYGDAGK